MTEGIKQKLIALNNEELEVLRKRVKCFNDVEKRKELDKRCTKIRQEIGAIIYNHDIVGKDFNIDKDYYTIPEIHANFDEAADLEREYWRLKIQEEESKCTEPKPEPFNETAETFSIKGDIVITDPCYIREFVRPMHSRSTIYGDWGCSVYEFDPTVCDTPKKGTKPFGEFCADAAMVCVTAINKEERKKIEAWLKERKWCATIIEDFDGTVEYIERVEHYAYNGQWEEDRSLFIRGKGTKHGKPFGFITSQTSL